MSNGKLLQLTWCVAALFNVRLLAQSNVPSNTDLQKQQWIQMITSGKANLVASEVEAYLTQNPPAPVKGDLLYVLARARLKENVSHSKAVEAVNDFVAILPNDERGGELLFRLAGIETEPQQRIDTYGRVIRQYPATTWAKNAKGAIRRIQSVGQPFDLSFTDAITGKPIVLQRDYKGKVVVIEFWAGWCSDCAAEMPHMKALYEKFNGQGVEFIGVSLDRPESEGGLVTLKTAVAKQQIPWPQFYQGNYFESEFSSSWGINAIPSAFVIDREGKLLSTEGIDRLEMVLTSATAPAR